MRSRLHITLSNLNSKYNYGDKRCNGVEVMDLRGNKIKRFWTEYCIILKNLNTNAQL